MSPYWSYYEAAAPKEVKNGLKAKSRRGCIGETWWSKRWVGTLESFNLGARLTRGKSYARKGQVISIDVEPGRVLAKVQGTMSKPYDVSIALKPLSDANWDKVAQVMASKAVFAARLLSGDMPQNIEEAFSEAKVSLFPERNLDLKTDCSCPDWSNPCKHIAAVYYLLAEQFDGDPFLIFKLRGRTKDQIIEALRCLRSSGNEEGPDSRKDPAATVFAEEKNLEEFLDCFWQKHGIADQLEFDLNGPKVALSVLKRLGDSPIALGKDNLTSLLAKAYETASRSAQKRAQGEVDGSVKNSTSLDLVDDSQ
ncbi:MAG: hypothetical protein EHM14_03200 [Methanothrix sp.]|nr:MAG: hypothetical protein EHM14_03200 [Methanothrix sp.]